MIRSRAFALQNPAADPPAAIRPGRMSFAFCYAKAIGGAYRDRTDDLLNANQALSQLS